MEFRQLELFLAAAHHGSLRAAADAAGISQPALTKSIHRLEEVLGVRLFERHARGIRLTSFGEALLLHAQTLQAELLHATETMRELRSTASGLVRIGSGPSMGTTLLPLVTARLLQKGRAIRLHVRSGLNDSILAALQAGELDFAITSMPSAPINGLVHQRLFLDRVVVISRRGHPLAACAAFADLDRAQWVMPNRNVLTRVRLTELFQQNGMEGPDIRIETDSIPYLLEAVAHTDLLSFVPTQLMGGRTLVEVAVPKAAWQRTVGLSYWRRHTSTPAKRLFLSVLQEVAREMHGA